MVKKASKKSAEEPLKLFYIFYNQERWDNWLKTLSEASFDGDPKSDELPEGFRILDGFSVDITLEVLKIIKLYQNKAEVANHSTPHGITGSRQETIALVPTKPGTVALPEIRIPWWDKDKQQVQYAVLPATRLVVHGAPGAERVYAGPRAQ